MTPVFRARLQIAMVLGAAFGIRLAAGYWWQTRLPDDQLFVFGDSQSYWDLAQTIAAGEPYQIGAETGRVFRTPGYPLILSVIFTVVGNDPHVMWARALGALLGSIAVGAVYWLANVLFDRMTAIVSATVAAAYPGAVAISTFVLSEALFCPLLVAQLALLAKCWREAKLQRCFWLALLAGVVSGAATLTRPSWLLFAPWLLVLTTWVASERRRNCTIGLCFLSGTIIVMVPWWIRNYQVTSRFVPTTLQVGASLYDGLNPLATGASNMQFVEDIDAVKLDELRFQSQRVGETLEFGLDRHFRSEAIDWARRHPARVVQLAGIKWLRMWSPITHAQQFDGRFTRFVLWATYLPLLATALWGAFKFTRLGWPYALCCLPAVYLTLLHMVFVSSIRYRQPAMLPLIVLAVGAVLHHFRWVSAVPAKRK